MLASWNIMMDIFPGCRRTQNGNQKIATNYIPGRRSKQCQAWRQALLLMCTAVIVP